MAHMIDVSNNSANVAYVGETPWHGLGQKLTPDADLDVWTREAGFNWEVTSAPVSFEIPGGDLVQVPRRNVLYRSDTLKPLSVVSDNYNITQPRDVAEFFRELVTVGGFKMETMGMLKGGAVYWALARVDDTFDVGNVGDTVLPYLLLATSCDGSLANTATFTTIRVVCNNTLTPAANGASIRIPHSTAFNPTRIKSEMGLIGGSWERFKESSSEMRRYNLSKEDAVKFFLNVLYPNQDTVDLTQTRPQLAQLLGTYENGVGQDLAGGDNLWRCINAVTRMVDFERKSASNDNRLTSAWFGSGNNLKQRAWSQALELIAA